MGILIFLVLLSVLIIGHELGHFLAARHFKVKIEEFGLGLPPRIWGLKRKETIYSLNALPLGGFVRLYGEEGEHQNDPSSFASKKIGERFAILSAGVLVNFLIAFFLFIFLFSMGAPSLVTTANKNYIKSLEVKISEVAKNSPAQTADLKIGDSIVGGIYADSKLERDLYLYQFNIEQFQNWVKEHSDQEIRLVIKRGKELQDKAVVPRLNPPQNEGPLGLGLIETAIVSFPFPLNIWEALKSLVKGSLEIVAAVVQNIRAAFNHEPLSVTGPVGIAVISSKTYALGWHYIFSFMSVLSLNLAVINFLPFPALDGGRLLFLLIEKIRKKPIPARWEAAFNNLGFALLLFLLFLITINDIRQFI